MKTQFRVVAIAVFLLSAIAVAAQEDARIIDDFEAGELFLAQDSFGNSIGFVAWGDTPGNVALSVADVEREGEATSALAVTYDIGSWGGFTHALTDGESWISQNWTDFNALQFWLYGNNTGGFIQVEIFDNRNPGMNADSAERWFYRVLDDYEGWQEFTIPFGSFQRRTDWQPGGAPNDGLGLDAVSGYAFGFPAGTGETVAYLDNVRLVFTEAEPVVVDDFEADGLLLAQDEFGNALGYVVWSDTSGSVELHTFEATLGGAQTGALAVTYDISGWGGFTHVFNDGENWISQDWTNFNAVGFWLSGNNTGGIIQFEIFDNRNPDLNGDSAERWFTQITDDYNGWRQFEIPFEAFQRRTDWQPEGAPDDGLNLDAVSGYAFGFPAGTGRRMAYIDNIRLLVMPGLSMPDAPQPDAPAAAEPQQPAEVILNDALLAPIPFAEPVVIADHEAGLSYVTVPEGPAIGFVPWGDNLGNVTIGTTQVLPFQPLSLPETTGVNQIMSVHYDIGSWGGFTYAFANEQAWVSQDWTGHNALQFWLYGNNTGGIVQVDIFDNRQPDSAADTAERFFFQLSDNYDGWQRFTIPFAHFQRRTDWQPDNAPDDGFNLDAVSGYAFGFPAGVGEHTAYLDEVQIVVVEDPTRVEITGSPAPINYEVDESITWTSREWDLLWADEFDAEAGAPINDEHWTCETGGWGWGNNELEYYTNRPENVSHDGSGNLVISARREATEGDTCWYGKCAFTSARCTTEDKMEFTYGRVEARLKVPTGTGIWPAFWMLGANFDTVEWPASGEIDIMEHVGEPNRVYGALHGPGYSGGENIGATFASETPYAEDFHVYAIDWDEYVVRWYIDGELLNITSVNDVGGHQWVFDQDFFILMNVAVGGFWPGNPTEDTPFPQEMLVDYVRVYQLRSE